MISLLRAYPAFRRLWLAGATSLIGDWLSFVAVAALALSGGGGPLGLALVFAAQALPSAIVSPLAGAIVDRFDRRRVLVVVDLAAAALTTAMALACLVGWFAIVPILLMLRSAVTSAVPPGESAALRHVVPAAELIRANTILAGTWSVAYVAGMALGGAAALLGPTLAIALDAGSFLLAASIHATLPPMPVAASERLHLLAVVRRVPADTRVALRHAAARRDTLLRAVLAKAPVGLAAGAGWIALNLIGAADRPFGPAALSFGILQALRGAGTGLGPALASRLIAGGIPERRLVQIAYGTAFAMIAVLGLVHSPLALAVVALVWGMGSGANWVLAHSALQRYSNDAVIGRLAAFDELLVTAAMVASAFVGAEVAIVASTSAVALVGAGLGLAGFVAVTLATRSSARAGDDEVRHVTDP